MVPIPKLAMYAGLAGLLAWPAAAQTQTAGPAAGEEAMQTAADSVAPGGEAAAIPSRQGEGAAAAPAAAAQNATLRLGPHWPGLYDSPTGAQTNSTEPGVCASRADPTIAAGGSLLEITSTLTYARWPPNGQSDKSFPEMLANFFGNGLFPKSEPAGEGQVLYDQAAGRFVLVASVRDNAARQAWIAVGTTANHEPFGATDCTVAIDANQQGTQPDSDFWADGIRIGMTQDSIVVTADMRAFDANSTWQYAKLWVFPKAGLYNAAGQQCPSGARGYRYWWRLMNLDSSLAVALVPAKSYAANSVTYLLASRTSGGKDLTLFGLDSQQGTLTVGSVPVKPYSPPPPAPQRSSSVLINTGDARLTNAVYQPNSGLWTVHSTACPWDKALSCFKWYDIDPVGGRPLQDSFFGYTVDSVYAPAVGVSRNAAVFVYNASSKDHFVDVDVVGRYAGDPVDVLGQSWQFRAGVDVYTRGAPAAHGGADSDPNDDNRLWISGAWTSGNAGDRNATCPDGTLNHDWTVEMGSVYFAK